MEVQRRRHAGADVVTVHGELDVHAARALEPVYESCVQESSGALIADYAGVTFADSMAIGQLITLRSRLAADRRALIVVSALPKVRRVLAMTGADQAVPAVASVEDALAVLRRA